MFSIASGYMSACVLGSIFGFQGSVSPGPLQTVIITETLANGIRSSWRAAVIPLCTDPIALCIALFIVANVPNSILPAIAFLGAALLCRVAWLQFRTTENDFKFQTKKDFPFFRFGRRIFSIPIYGSSPLPSTLFRYTITIRKGDSGSPQRFVDFFPRALRVQFIRRCYCRRTGAGLQSFLAGSRQSSIRRFPPSCRRSLRYFRSDKAWRL